MRGFVVFIAALSVTVTLSCKKLQDAAQGMNPNYVTTQFLKGSKQQDWKTVFRFSHPNIMPLIRSQKLTEAQKKMSDEDLFVLEFSTAARRDPSKLLRTYEVKMVPDYKKGDTTLWVNVVMNGRNVKLPLTLDGPSLKVDLVKMMK